MSKISYYINPYKWIAQDLQKRENTKAVINYIFWKPIEFFLNNTDSKTFSIQKFDPDQEKKSWIYENIPYKEEEKILFKKTIQQWKKNKKIYKENQIKVSKKEKKQIQKEILTELFFWNIIVPTLKKENLPYWKKSFDELSEEQQNIFITLNKKIVLLQNTLNNLSVLIGYNIPLHFIKNKEKSVIKITENDLDLLPYFNKIQKIFPVDISEYELSLNNIEETQRSFTVYGDSKETITSHEKIKFKKFLKDHGINLPKE